MKHLGAAAFRLCRLAAMVLLVGLMLAANSAPAHAGWWQKVKDALIKAYEFMNCSETLGCGNGVPLAVASLDENGGTIVVILPQTFIG